MTDCELVELAFSMLERSYSPYSGFAVGAALLCAVNRGDTEAALPLPEGWAGWTVNLGDGRVEGDILRLPPLGCAILIDNGEEI